MRVTKETVISMADNKALNEEIKDLENLGEEMGEKPAGACEEAKELADEPSAIEQEAQHAESVEEHVEKHLEKLEK